MKISIATPFVSIPADRWRERSTEVILRESDVFRRRNDALG